MIIKFTFQSNSALLLFCIEKHISLLILYTTYNITLAVFSTSPQILYLVQHRNPRENTPPKKTKTPVFGQKQTTIPLLRRSRPAQGRRQLLTISFKTAALLAASFILFLILAVSAASMTWNRYRESKLDWAETICTLVEGNPTEVSECSRGLPPFRADILVEGIVEVADTIQQPFDPIREEDGNIEASRGAAACIFDTEDDANDYANQFADKGGEDVVCYTDGQRVRLTEGAEEDSVQGLLRLRAIFATFASVFAALAVLYSLYHLCVVATRPSTNPPPRTRVSPISPVATAQNGYRRPLSVKDTNLLVDSFDEGHDGGTCPICLEEFEGDSRKAITLPCKHAYHEECALQWFRKGHASCPYCNYDLGEEVQKVRADHDAKAEHRHPERSSSSSSTLDRPSWPTRNRSVRYGQTEETSQS